MVVRQSKNSYRTSWHPACHWPCHALLLLLLLLLLLRFTWAVAVRARVGEGWGWVAEGWGCSRTGKQTQLAHDR